MGLTVLIFGVIFFLCPLILYIAVIQPGPAAK